MQEKKWDWKNAPEWATHVGECWGYLIWFNSEQYMYAYDGYPPYEWSNEKFKYNMPKSHVLVFESRPVKQENLWDGEGIPANGAIFNTNFDGKKYKVKVVCQAFVDCHQSDKVVAVVGLEGERKYLLWWTNDYQKIKTNEEIEAEKEEKCQVDLIYRHLVQQTELSDTPLEALLTTAKNLYEDGLRFIDKTN